MQDNYLVEIFRKDYSFLSKALVKAQKYEFDYMALGNNTLVIPGFMEVYKRDYIQMTSDSGKIQGIVTSVEYKAAETSVKYKPLLSLLDVDVYKERKELQGMLGSMELRCRRGVYQREKRTVRGEWDEACDFNKSSVFETGRNKI